MRLKGVWWQQEDVTSSDFILTCWITVTDWRSDRRKGGQLLIPNLNRDTHQVCGEDEMKTCQRWRVAPNEDHLLSSHLLPGSQRALCHFQHTLFFPERARPSYPSVPGCHGCRRRQRGHSSDSASPRFALVREKRGNEAASEKIKKTRSNPADRNTEKPRLGVHPLACSPWSLYNGYIRIHAPHVALFLWQQQVTLQLWLLVWIEKNAFL